MGNVEDPSSFRAVVLQECTMKFVESMWIHSTRVEVEKEAGINHAYKSGSGVFSAFADLNRKMKDTSDGLVYFFDVKSAFPSNNRRNAFDDLFAKFPSEKYLRKVEKCYNKLMMDVNLGFMTVTDIP